MKFEQIYIDEKSFKELVSKLTDEFSLTEDNSFENFLKRALKKHIFKVVPKFKEGEWNNCMIFPSNKINSKYLDVIIRCSDTSLEPRLAYSFSQYSYNLAIYDVENQKFLNSSGENIFRYKPQDKYEYKFI